MREFDWRTALIEADPGNAALRIGLLMATYGDYKTGRNVRPSLVTIAERLGYTREHVTKTTKKALVTGGWLTPTGEKGPNGVVEYVLTLPTEQGDSSQSPVNSWSSHNLVTTNKKAAPKAALKKKTTARKAVAREPYVGIMPTDYDYNGASERPQSEDAPF